MKMKILGSVALGCAVLLSSTHLRAQTPADDKTFLKAASESDLAEIKQSELALAKSKNANIKSFAQQMITDHKMLSAKAKPFADSMGVAPATLLTTAHQGQYDKLRHLSGKAFNQAYMQGMVADHQAADDLFKQEIASTQNTDLKDTLTGGEKVVASHLQMANELAGKVGATPGASGR